MNAYDILEDSLNLRDVRVYDTVRDENGKEKRVLNGKQTTLAQQKQQLVRDAFKDWIWADPTRRQTLVEQYNREMNSIRPREYDGSHIVFAGMNPEIRLREHQRNAIAHVLYGGNTLLAHEVGAGKTFEMVGAAMEAKRLGLCRKSLFVVPNHLTEQWASEFLRLYPSANILVTKQKDFETQNRKKFCARIATGDYDAVIIGHSQFEKIPISQERQEALLKNQIEEISTGIWELKANRAERFTVKQMERAKRSLEGRLEKLQAEHKKDDVVTFEELGIDRLIVDEAHSYKNLFLYTKMQNVAGLSTSDAQKSSDMFAKLTQLVFCDVSTPQAAVKAKATALDPHSGIAKPFTVYEDIRSKLIAQVVPPEQIAFIHDANSEAKKKELFGKVRSGQVRVLLGSTAKMGAGTNVQDRLVAIHDLDCPWRPGDLQQRKGRIERQGNPNEKVHVFRYVTEGTFDAYLWQTVENKQKVRPDRVQ